MTVQQFILILRARWLVVLGVFLAVVGSTVALNLLLTPKYTSQTSVVIDSKSSDPILGAMLPGQTLTSYIATQVDIISSERVAQRVATLLKLDKVPLIEQQWRNETGGEGALIVWLGKLLRGNLEVVPGRDSNVINIGYTGSDPQLAATVANGFAQAYIETNLELKVEPARQYAEWFDGRTKSLRDDMERAQKKLSEYQQAQGIVATDERLDIESARLAEISTQLSIAQGQRVESNSRLSQRGSADTLQEVMQNGLIQSLKGNLAQLESQRDQLAVKLGRNHPELQSVETEIRAVRDKIAAETSRVASSLGTTNRVSSARVAELKASLEAQKTRVLTLRAQRDEIAVLQRDVENAQRNFDLVTQRLAQSNLESQTQQTNVVVLTPAVPSTEPSSPMVMRNILIGIVMGLALGVGVAVLLEFFNARVRSSDDLAGALGLPVLGVLPSREGKVARGAFGWRAQSAAR